MAGLLIAVFLGWAGGYRFYKKQTVPGIVYLLTFGVFGIGWVIDIIIAAAAYKKSKGPVVLTVDVKGAFAECKKNPSIRRKDVIKGLSVGAPLQLVTDFYEGKPYYLVCAGDLDIGALPKEISGMIRGQYSNAHLSAELFKKDFDVPVITLTIKP